MATEFVIMLPDGAKSMDAAVQAADLVESIERDLSVYRPDSEVSKINRLAAQQPVRVSKPTFSLLERAVGLSEQTEGAFDITTGPLIDAWGFTKRSGRKPTAAEVKQALTRVGYQRLVLDRETSSVRFATAGMAINLGAIGKGDALDRMALELQSHGVTDFLIHGGNSSVVAVGDQDPGSSKGWAVGLAHPTKPQRRLAGLWLKNAAIATSGSGKQFFHHRGRRYGHVIDPRTGYPAGDLMSLTLAMGSATDVDAVATALFVAGSQQVRQRYQEDGFSLAIMTRALGQQDSVEVETLGDFDWIETPQADETGTKDAKSSENSIFQLPS
ncbi:FAD:protein FMN transferase [Novipirellula artificiosorum]|uniref:FAD:protein FMN transferase n=1 Tax=Novipirellula artificiosorum TaxID=2528016 RepID=A0A5C6DZA6_9BACT|nr:FAD:protein FMN transferase [Novipirellula artificiosorum]TWU41932.1 Thiamine biosynthesis lipoprotein ApbE precursor [Novipirellula artificiosorum]